MKLHSIVHNHEGKLWCGIAAISAITGNDSQHSKDCIRLAIDTMEKRQNRRIKGIYSDELLATLDYLMITYKQVYRFKRMGVIPPIGELDLQYTQLSIARFLLGYKPRAGNVFLIFMKDHVLTCDGNMICDNWTKQPVDAIRYRFVDQQVMNCYELDDTSLGDL